MNYLTKLLGIFALITLILGVGGLIGGALLLSTFAVMSYVLFALGGLFIFIFLYLFVFFCMELA